MALELGEVFWSDLVLMRDRHWHLMLDEVSVLAMVWESELVSLESEKELAMGSR